MILSIVKFGGPDDPYLVTVEGHAGNGEAFAEVIDLESLSQINRLCVARGLDPIAFASSVKDWKRNSGSAVRAKTETCVDSTSAPRPQRERPQPVAYQPFPVHVLPEPLRGTVNVGASALGCDRAFIALPLLSAAAAAIGNSRWIELKPGWREPPALWTALVAESGDLKTPAFKFAVRPLRERQLRTLRRHAEETAQYEIEALRYEKKLTAWKRSQNEDEPPPENPELPEAERCIISDVTTEAAALILAANPRGLLLARDELSGWFGGFDRYSGGRGGGDAACWLSMHNGESLVVDRKTGPRKIIFVPAALVSVTGGIQPGILRRVMSTGEYRDSGLLARLLLAMPPRRIRRWTDAEISPSSEATIALLFERLFALELEHDDQGEPRPRIMTLTPEAKRAWVNFYDRHAREHAELTGDLSAAWSKLEGYTARLALILHCIRWEAGDPTLESPDQVDEASITAGVTLSRWFSNEVRRVYAVMGESEGDREHRQLIELIGRKGGEITVREIVRSSRMFSNSDDAEAALRGLVDSGDGVWITSKSGPKGGQPSRRFRLVASTVDTVDVDNTPAGDPKTGGSVNVNSVNAPTSDDGDDWGVV